MLHLAPLILTSLASIGQVQVNYEHLKAAESFIGVWQHEQAGTNGAGVTQWTFAWTADKNALTISQFISINGKTTGRMDAIFGWDNRQQRIVGAGFATDGAAGGGWTMSPGDGRLAVTAGSNTWVFRLDGSDTLVLESGRETRANYQRAK